MKFHIIVMAWGELFVDLLLRVSLPNHLSPGNLPSFEDRGDSLYKIFTVPADAPKIRQSAAFRRLEATMPSRVIAAEGFEGEHPHARQIRFTRQAIQEAREEGACLLFLPPDVLWTDGTFRAASRHARAGKRAVVTPGLRISLESALPVVLARWPAEQPGLKPYPSRELAALALGHLHPLSECLFVDSGRFRNEWPSHMYWRVGREGLLCHGAHLHPLMIDPSGSASLGETTIDGAFLEELCPDPEDLHVVQDSDELMAYELTREDHFRPGPEARANPNRIARFIDAQTTALHRHFLVKPIRIHAGTCDGSWDRIEAVAGGVLSGLLGRTYIQCYEEGYLRAKVDGLLRQWQHRNAKVVIHGAGEHTARLMKWTALMDADIRGISDGNPAIQGQRRFGFDVIPPARIPELSPDVVLISSLYFWQEIYRDLRFLEGRGIELAGLYGSLQTPEELDQEVLEQETPVAHGR